MSERKNIPSRRPHTVIKLEHGAQSFHIGFGQVPGGPNLPPLPPIVEVFADGRKNGSDQQRALSDACIMMSLLLQHGMTMAQIRDSLGEIRNEGEETGAPASIFGVIARAGVELEKSE